MGKSKPEFDTHMNTHFEFNCPNCDYTSRTEGRLKRHIKDFHSEDTARRSMPGRPKVYKCKQCAFSATEKDKFWEHSRTHIKEDKLLQCPKCSFVTEYKHHLEYHLRNHFGSKPFKCPKCNYSCVNKSMLNSHMKSHTNVYQYRCSECTYATKYCHSLKLHLKKYNHKPATVLNQDGSLPQGLDVESSGLSIVSKRGPPRGPRGTRKDNSYLNNIFEMSQMPLGVAGMSPILNGMMPFWPMLPQTGVPGHPSLQPGMFPGIRNITQNRSIMAEHSGSTDDSKLDDTMGEISENSCEEIKGNTRGEDNICRLCSFIAESKEALSLHLMQVHKEESKEVIISYGFSETILVESFRRVKDDEKLEQKHIPEPLKEIDGHQPLTETNQRNSDAYFLYKKHLKSLQINTDHKEEFSKTPPLSWPPSSYSESRHEETHSNIIDNNSKNEDNHHITGSEIDILQQMTLKYGAGSLTRSRRSSEREDNVSYKKDDVNHKKDDVIHRKDSDQEPGSDGMQRFSQTPLDLTKPKSVSPPIFRNSPTHDNVHEKENEEHNILKCLDQVSLKSAESEINRKRQMLEMTDEILPADMSSVAPRKRSRKGKAYKLDTLCLKLQNKQANTILDDDDDAHDINTEHNTNQVSPVLVIEYNKQICTTDNDKSWKNKDIAGVSIMEVATTHYQQDQITAHAADNDIGKFKDCYDIPKNVIGKNSNLNDINKKKEVYNAECGIATENKPCVQDEAEFELQKLQLSLNLLNPGLNSSSLESAHMDISDKRKQLENRHRINEYEKCDDQIEDNSSEATIEEEPCLDGGTIDDAIIIEQSSEKCFDVDDEEQVEMINTVLENRKKAVPPAVRRGTELAWKLLNDPINPVTTLPLPVDALPTPPSLKVSSVSQTGTPVLQEFPNSIHTSVTRQDTKPHSSFLECTQYNSPAHQLSISHTQPHHSPVQQLHISHIPQTHHPAAQQLHIPHTSQLYPSHAQQLHKIHTTQPHHPNIPHQHHQHPIISMKSLMPIPIPSTPMAYIPPTNRLVPEPVTSSLSSRVKPSQKELYECTYCDLSFRDCVMYTVHMGYHSNQNPFQCNSCGVVSGDKVEFFLHIARSPHA